MTNRRTFFKQASLLGAGSVIGGSILPGCSGGNSRSALPLSTDKQLKIRKVETAWITVPFLRSQGLAGGDMANSTDVVCRITTDDGIRGIGEARGAHLPDICKVIMDEYTPLLMGENPMETHYLWTKLYDAKLAGMSPPNWGPMRPYQAALAAVDLALWDIKAKALGLSICELLGGKPHPLPVYLCKGFYVEGQSLGEMCEEAVAEINRFGFKYTKIRVGRYGVDDAIQRIAAFRKALGPDMQIAVDVNQAFDYDTTLDFLKRAEQYNLLWIEEPLGRTPRGNDVGKPDYDWDIYLGRLAKHTSTELSSGENHYTLIDSNSLITNGGIKYMQFDITKNGGLTEWLKVAALCEANNVLMAPHHVPHFHVMPTAAIANGFIIEYFDNKWHHPAWPHLFDGFPEVKDGMIACPSGTGWGMEVNENFLRSHGTLVSWNS